MYGGDRALSEETSEEAEHPLTESSSVARSNFSYATLILQLNINYTIMDLYMPHRALALTHK